MELSKVTDLKELKALAYDQLAAVEQAQANLKVINQRIVQLNEAERVVEPKAGKKK